MNNCPDGRRLSVAVSGKAVEPHRVRDIDPRAGPLELAVRRLAEPDAYLVGMVVGPDGQPIADARVSAMAQGHMGGTPITTGPDGRFEIGPLAAASWRMSVRAAELPSRYLDDLVVAAGQRLDLGRVQLPAGGKVTFVCEAVDLRHMHFMVAGEESGMWGLMPGADRPETSMLMPGRYRVMVWGPKAAALTLPFVVEAGAKKVVELPLAAGTMQHFDLEVADAAAAIGGGANLSIWRGSEQVVDWWLRHETGKPWQADIALLPGNYRVVAHGRLRAEAEFTVGEQAGAPVTLQMR